MTQISSPFFGAYNARHFNPEEVASQFVPSERFWKLIALRHSLLVGPRGSGKTHLLKMLQPKALGAWAHKEADRARRDVRYHGVFIAADVTWTSQVRQRALALSPELGAKYGVAVFISHFREALISCMLQLTHDRPKIDTSAFLKYELSQSREAELVARLASSWRLAPKVPSFLGLRQSIVDHIGDLALSRSYAESELAEFLGGFQPDVLSTARQAVEAFNSVSGNLDARWALCFDELEIAPREIQEELFACLRSTDQRLLFKLAISPFNLNAHVLNNMTSASAGNDYDPIPLWFADIRETTQFCRELWEQQTRGTGAQPLSPWAVLGHSKFHYVENTLPGRASRYRDSSTWSRVFTSLANKDQSFARYLHSKGVKPNALAEVETRLMDQVVRKVAPLVGFREAYLADFQDHRNTARLRIVKAPPADVFSGWEAVCILTEGNPRWFNGLVNRLIIKWEANGRALSRAAQAREFSAASEKFVAWISAVPVGALGLPPPLKGGLRGLVELLGGAFRRSVLDGPFLADPVLAFTVDKDLPDPIRELLVAALNVGAIVSMDDQEVDLALSNLTGHRFRLVHLLAPTFQLPLRTGKARSLRAILNQVLLRVARRSIDAPPVPTTSNGVGIGQEDLFRG